MSFQPWGKSCPSLHQTHPCMRFARWVHSSCYDSLSHSNLFLMYVGSRDLTASI
jgi:hypothetical protein